MMSNIVSNDKSTTVKTVETTARPGGMELVCPYKTTRHGDPNDLVELAQQVQTADQFTRANAGNKLRVIAEQIKFLQEQAKSILQEAKRDNDLHHAACNMVKKPGTIYYLYEKKSGQTYLSIVSPEEWGASNPNVFLGAYKLEFDMSWTSIENIGKREEDDAIVNKILNAQLAIENKK
ncbi:uncharacterized protein C1orf50 homolog [Tubulanus polymorphus]|uniref:uncharacterized protein C1orf50 homolog n=1 Tax=Tubulanus polymorphus TaxID=672921 RepID=UPI003DA69D16